MKSRFKSKFLTVTSRPGQAFFVSASNKQNAIAKTISRNGGTVVICAEVCPYDRATFEAILAKWQPESIDA
jgi:hypothetical protein